MTSKIDLPPDKIIDSRQRNRIRRLALFGSVLRDDFGPDSDVDVLVDFEPEARVGLITPAGIEDELDRLLGRQVEIHAPKGLNPREASELLADRPK